MVEYAPDLNAEEEKKKKEKEERMIRCKLKHTLHFY